MSLRRIVSLTLLLSAAAELITSIILYIEPQGRVAYWSGWTMWGLSKDQWGALHTNLGLLMLVAAVLHTWYNWRPIMNYLRNKAREFILFTPDFSFALVILAAFTVLTLAQLPPTVWIQDLRASFEEGAAETYGEPPYGHAEQSSLRVFLRNVGMDPKTARENLDAAGIEVTDPEITILELARENGLNPAGLYEIIRGPEDLRPTEPLPIPETMPMGTGRKTLAQFCEEYNRDLPRAVAILEAAGLTVDPQKSLKDIASENDIEALDILDILRQGYGEQGSGRPAE